MDKRLDEHGALDDEVFSYHISKDGKVFISWHGKPVTTLRGPKAAEFTARIGSAEGKEAQLIMAKATGNFKRGNEK